MRFALIALALLAAGCGGGGFAGVASHGGSITTRVAWPTSDSRVIPAAAKTIRIDVRQGTTSVASTLITRPASTGTVADVPVGSFTVRATAYADLAGTGTALASAEVPNVIVLDGIPTPVNLTMNSSVATLTVSPTSVNLLLTLLSSQQLTVTGRDLSGTVVVIDPTDVTYSSSVPLVATVTSTGLIVGLLPGDTTITVTEKSSGLVKTVPVHVVL